MPGFENGMRVNFVFHAVSLKSFRQDIFIPQESFSTLGLTKIMFTVNAFRIIFTNSKAILFTGKT